MSMIEKIFLAASSKLIREIEKSKNDAATYQRRWLATLLNAGNQTSFGLEHCFNRYNFNNKKDYYQKLKYYQNNVPIREYDDFVPYINRLRNGEDYVLWNQKTRWFAKSSGTSSERSKFIPITPDSLRINHYGGFRRMLAWYLANNPDSRLFGGKSLTLGGSITPDTLSGGFFCGDLSAILLQNSPFMAELFRSPEKKSALTGNFDKKLELICKECSTQNITNFSGVPSWNLIMLNRILEYTGKENIKEVWPHLELFMHGGIGFEPYREIYRKIIPDSSMHYLENYNASEGYFAFQDDLSENSMLLTVNNGIFYEFIPMEIFEDVMEGHIKEIPTLEEVKLGVTYAVVITTCGGLWRYLIGDCVEFTSLSPYRIKIVGRTQLHINAFGEELMISNAERALSTACAECNASVTDFTVAPVFMELGSKGYHKWAIEFEKSPADMELFAQRLDAAICSLNSDYAAKRENSTTMSQLQVIPLPKGRFYNWMAQRNKLGGQNKVPRLYKESRFIDELVALSDLQEKN